MTSNIVHIYLSVCDERRYRRGTKSRATLGDATLAGRGHVLMWLRYKACVCVCPRAPLVTSSVYYPNHILPWKQTHVKKHVPGTWFSSFLSIVSLALGFTWLQPHMVEWSLLFVYGNCKSPTSHQKPKWKEYVLVCSSTRYWKKTCKMPLNHLGSCRNDTVSRWQLLPSWSCEELERQNCSWCGENSIWGTTVLLTSMNCWTFKPITQKPSYNHYQSVSQQQE